ncbi:MAG: hypothetical protein ABIH69_05130 [bacterium]
MAEDLKNTFEVFMNKEGMLIARFNQLITDPDYQVVFDFIVSSINRQERVRWFGDVKKAIAWLKKDK